jgi:simple sugar transport system permease protein
MDLLTGILVSLVVAATPLVFAAIGELVVEKSGVLNLGVEGMMIIGAIAGFAVTIETESYLAGLVAAALAGTLMALLFGLITLTLLANQVASGLALTLFGLGLSALIGQSYSGKSAGAFPHVHISGLTDLPIIGHLFFGQDWLVYLSLGLVAGVAWFLTRTRAGLVLRAVGESHDAAHAIGYPVILYRYAALAFGGACAGLGGAYLSLVQAPLWVERMTAGRGWIALALVVFAAWRPWRTVLGAYLFGGVSILQLHGQGMGLKIEAQYLSMLPYLATILVLVLISRSRTSAPASLGKPFFATT